MLKPEALTTYLPPPLIKRLKVTAKKEGILIRELIRQALETKLAEKQEEKRA